MLFRKSAWLVSAGALALAANMNSTAQSQTAQDASEDVDRDVRQLDTVKVRGIRGALASEQSRKRAADSIIDGISAEDIGKLPDENVTEAIQRVPGVQIERDAGEGTSISIRGLPQNRVEIGGIRLVSPIGRQETGNPEEVSVIQAIPSALLSRIEVSKSPTADQVEGALGGTVSLELRKPFDLGNKAVFGVGLRMDERADSIDPVGDLTFSRVSDDGRFGGLFAITAQDRTLKQEEFNNRSGWRDRVEGGQTYSSNIESRYQERSEERSRLGISAIGQYRPDPSTEFFVTGLYSEFTLDRERDWFAYSASGSTVPSFYTPGTVVTEQDATRPDVLNIVGGEFAAQAQNNAEDFTDETVSYNLGIGFEHDRGPWAFSGALTYGIGERETFQNFVRFRENGVTFIKDYTTDVPTVLPAGGFDPTDITQYTGSVVGFVNEFKYYSDETVVELDVERDLDVAGLTSVEIGARFTDQSSERESFRSRRPGFDPAFGTGGSSVYTIPIDVYLANFGEEATRTADISDVFGGGFSIDSFVSPNPSVAGASNLLTLGGRAGGQAVLDPFTSYVTDETISAVYVKGNFGGDGFYGNVGLRAVQTEQDSSGFAFNPSAGFNTPVSFSRTYQNYLPSANITFELREDLLFRLAASRVMSRPSTFNLSFSTNLNELSGTGRINEADLPPLIADALDASLEWYINDASSLTFGLFYKDVSAFPISVSQCEQVVGATNLDDLGDADPSNDVQRTCSEFGPDFFDITRTDNADGLLRGAEFSGSYVFDNGFGARFNYTYIDSRSPFTDPATDAPVGLPNLSENSLNLVGFYEKGPFGARLAYNWRDSYLRNVNFTANNSLSQEARGQLDASVSYDINERFSVSASAINVTDEESRIFNLNEARPMFYTGTGRRFLFGLRGRF